MTTVAIVPTRILRRWDAIALEQLARRAADLQADNEYLRGRLADAESCAEFWQENATKLAGDNPGLLITGEIVRMPEARP